MRMTTLLTPRCRHRGDAEIDLLAVERQPDAAVLREPPFGDVEARQDLDPGDDALGKRRRQHLLAVFEHAGRSKAHPYAGAVCLYVDVGCAAKDTFGDDAVDGADDLVADDPHLFLRVPLRVLLIEADVFCGRHPGLAFRGSADAGPEPREGVDEVLDGDRRHLNVDRLEHPFDLGDRNLVLRRDHPDDQRLVVERQREHLVLLDQLKRDHLHQLRARVELGDLDELDAFLGEGRELEVRPGRRRHRRSARRRDLHQRHLHDAHRQLLGERVPESGSLGRELREDLGGDLEDDGLRGGSDSLLVGTFEDRADLADQIAGAERLDVVGLPARRVDPSGP